MDRNNVTILERISDGPTAVVYRGMQNALGREVLIKQLQRHLVGNAESRERFLREARAYALLHSEHIVQVFDVTEYDGAPTIVMEYVPGRSLDQILIERGIRSEVEAIEITKGILAALAYAHEKGVVHRDIKPGNILISEHGVVKVTDFGIASVAAAPSLTADGNLVGTPAYMSPEQARGEAVDHRTDLFSLGVTLVEVTTGARMFGGESYAECLTKIMKFDVSALEEHSKGFSPRFGEFLIRLMTPRRGDRFSSALDALEFIAGGSDAAVRQFGLRRTRRRSAVLLTAAVVVMLSTALTLLNTKRNESPSLPSGEPLPTVHNQTTPGTETGAMRSTPSKDARPEGNENLAVSSAVRSVTSKDSGFVSIVCLPWAKVFIDDRYIETTPIAGTMKLAPGKHVITFSNPDFVPVARTITVQRRMQTTVAVDFMENAGFIFVTATPWADVFIDDQYRETTPVNRPFVVTAGTRKLRLRNPGFGDLVKELNVGPRDTVRFNHVFH